MAEFRSSEKLFSFVTHTRTYSFGIFTNDTSLLCSLK